MVVLPAHISCDKNGIHHFVFQITTQHIGAHQIPFSIDVQGQRMRFVYIVGVIMQHQPTVTIPTGGRGRGGREEEGRGGGEG